jgi:hypothetical protein
MLQFEGVLLYKLIPNEAEITMPNIIYLVLAWKVATFSGLYVYMNLIEHDGDPVFLESNAVEKHYYQLFRDKTRKPNRANKFSWFLDESIPFIIRMTADNGRFGKINVEIEEGRCERSKSRPM